MGSLSGKRVVVTRPENQSLGFNEILLDSGALPINLPTIKIVPPANTEYLDRALFNVANYDWLILTSINAVEAIWNRFDVLGIQFLPETLKIACIGSKTAASLQRRGYQADFVPNEFKGEAIIPGLGNLIGLKVLLPSSAISRPDLPEAIRAGGGIVDYFCAYQVQPAKLNKKSLFQMSNGVEVLTFTSPSTVNYFVQMIEKEGMNPLNLLGAPITACIGPITAQAAINKGFQVDVVPTEYTIEGLVRALQIFYEEQINERE